MRYALGIFFKILGGLTFTGLVLFVLIAIEAIMPYGSKPSTRLQAFLADAPPIDLQNELDALSKKKSQIEDEVQVLKETLEKEQSIQNGLSGHYQALMARVEDQNLTVWSIPYQP